MSYSGMIEVLAGGTASTPSTKGRGGTQPSKASAPRKDGRGETQPSSWLSSNGGTASTSELKNS